MKLISMCDFVLYQDNSKNDFVDFKIKILNYANFLKQPLELWMFVPCDDGNVLEEPIETIGGVEMYTKQYQQAKDRCLFICNSINIRQIENLVKLKITVEQFNHEVELTPTAIKQIGL